MKSIIRFFALSLFVLATYSGSAQTIPELQQIKSPEAAALQKAIDIPVSMYSGTANVSIPLYSININGASVPISLSYNGSGGIKVDEEATMVGLGWQLSYGGSVSRTLKNKPDEFCFLEKQSLADFFSLPSFLQDTPQQDAVWYMRDTKSNTGVYDLSADEFNYSAGGYSGAFMYKQSTSKFIIFPKEDIEVSYTRDLVGSSPPIRKWDLKMPDGTKYTYGGEGISRTLPVTLSPPPAMSGALNYNVDNMWAIKKITTIYGDSIVYNYNQIMYPSYSRPTSESCSEKNGAIQLITTRPVTNIIEPILQSISFKGGNVSFTTSNRIDTPTKKVDEIVVSTSSGQVIKKIKFYYSYFNGNFGIVPSFYRLGTTDDLENKRLRLDSISMTGSDNVNVEKYKFTYYDNNGILPSKYSFAQDLWGYFNGRNNTTFVPKLVYWVTNGADRKVNNAVNNVFTLKTITYPTKGKSEFIYEGNVVKRGAFSEFNSMLNSDPYLDQSETLTIGSLSPTLITAGEKHYYKPFTVPANGGYPHPQGWSWVFGANLSGLTVSSDCSFNYAVFKLEKANTDGSYQTIQFHKYCYNTGVPADSEGMVWLSPGNYRLVIITMFPTISNDQLLSGLSTSIKWKNSYPNDSSTANTSLNVGGLRVQQIINYSNEGTPVSKRQYEYLDANGYSSGSMYAEPRNMQLYYLENTSPNGSPETPNWGPNLTVYGNSLTPLKPISGSYVGYQYVTEKLVDVTNGLSAPLKTRYSYTYSSPNNDAYASPTVYLDGLTEHHDWQFGKLKKVEYYKGTQVVKQEDYNYINNLNINPNDSFVDEILVEHISWKSLNIEGSIASDFTDNYLLEGHYGQFPQQNPIFIKRYIYGVKSAYNTTNPNQQEAVFANMTLPYIKHYTGSDKLSSKTTTTFDDLGNAIVQTETYTYNSAVHNQLTTTETTNSLGQTQQQKFYYPKDFLSETVYNQMDQKHMVSQVVKQESYVAGTLLSTFKTNYYNWGTFIAPISVEVQKAAQTSEIRFSYNNYDVFGNMLSATPNGGSATCYVYSYNNKYPVAEIKNADYTTLVSVLGGATAISNFSASNPTDTQLNTFLNPLRSSTLLTNAMVNTFTYKPLVGITTMTDPKGDKVTYTYDNFGRLISVKDKYNNVLSENQYNYRP